MENVLVVLNPYILTLFFYIFGTLIPNIFDIVKQAFSNPLHTILPSGILVAFTQRFSNLQFR